jgi:hypothetical protein
VLHRLGEAEPDGVVSVGKADLRAASSSARPSPME